jgi:hypothetical protein
MSTLKSFPYDVPATLEREKLLVIEKCNLLLEAFDQLCKEEKERIKQERINKLNSRVFEYSIRELDNFGNGGWKVLYKEATAETSVGEDSDIAWSIPFKIINGVLIQSRDHFKSRSWENANKLIPQGLFDESSLTEINKGW